MIFSGDDPVSKRAQRFEVFTGAGKRREWPPVVKASIVAECYSGREGVSAVARRHGLDPSQVYAWRRDLRKQRIHPVRAAALTGWIPNCKRMGSIFGRLGKVPAFSNPVKWRSIGKAATLAHRLAC